MREREKEKEERNDLTFLLSLKGISRGAFILGLPRYQDFNGEYRSRCLRRLGIFT